MAQDKNRNNSNRINDQIRCLTVMLISDGKNLGIFTTDEAKRMARESGLDLVEVAPNSKPPVCHIMDYGKFKYEQSVKEKEKKKSQKHQEKELRLRPSIGEHDLLVRINSAKKFLEKGCRVRFRLEYKARENSHKELGLKVIERISRELEGTGILQGQAKIEGKILSCIFDPNKGE